MKKKNLSILLSLALLTSCNANINNLNNQNYNNDTILKDNNNEISKIEVNVTNLSIVDGQSFQLAVKNTSEAINYSVDSYDKDFFTVSTSGLLTCKFTNPSQYTTLDNLVSLKKVTISLVSNPEIYTEVYVQVYTTAQSLLLGEFDVDTHNNEVTFLGLIDKNLTSYTIPDEVSKAGVSFPVNHIADKAFINNKNITIITMPDTISSIGDDVFYNCSSLVTIKSTADTTDTNVLPSSLTTIGKRSFYNCVSLSQINLGDKCTYIGSSCFYNCTSLSAFAFKEGTLAIEDLTFYNCSSLDQLTYASTIKEIKYAAFKGCKKLFNSTTNKTNDLPVSLEKIGAYAFSETTFKILNIKANLTSIDQTALLDGEVNKFVVDNSNNVFTVRGSTTTLFSKDRSIIYFVGKDADSISSDDWNVLTEVKAYAAYNCSKLKGGFYIYYWQHITKIGDYAFAGSGVVGTGTISNNTDYGVGVFSNCKSLTSITLSSSLTAIPDYMFQGCTSLTSVNGLSSIKSIGKYAFAGCESYTTFDLASTVEKIGYAAFINCKGLTSITIPEATTSVGNLAFAGCDKLNITLKEGQDENFDPYWNIDNLPVNNK